MKKLLIILLCLPLFIFSQEERKYEKTISFFQFAKELKDAADNGIRYTLENCFIVNDNAKAHGDINTAFDKLLMSVQ